MQTTSRTRVAATIAAAVLVLPGGAWAGTVLFKQFSGSTDRWTTASVSDHGNVLAFGGPAVAGADYEHMRVGALSDGYVLCYRNPTTNAYVNAFDVGSAESGFGAATPTDGGAANMGVVRATSDGVLTLEQGFSFHGKEKRMMVLMNIRNANPFPITDVVLRRQADFDVDSAGADGWAGSANLWARTSRESVFAWNEPSTGARVGKEAHGMLMTHRAAHVYKSGTYTEIPAWKRSAKVTEKPLDSSCSPPAKSTPVTTPSDDGATVQVDIGTIPAAPAPGDDASAAVAVWYQRI